MNYQIKGNQTAQDVIAGNDVIIDEGITDVEEARRIAICAQSFEGYIAAWVEPTTADAEGEDNG